MTKDHLAAVVVKNRRHGVAQPRRHVPLRGRRRRGAGVAVGVRAAAPVDAVHAQRGRRRRGAARAAGDAPTSAAPAARVRLGAAVLRSHLPGIGAQRVDAHVGTRRRRRPGPDHAGRHGRLRGGRGRPRRPRRRRVPGHRRGARAALVRGARAVRAGRGGRAARRRCHRAGRTHSRSTPAAGCCPRASRSAPPPSARWSRSSTSCAATPGRNQVEGARVALAHTVGRGANASVVILTR